ncbi:MAG TPA: phosphate/phosphite/phosphonate ABC transporter substrate-binding protein [Lacipirellulaceae bacterium]|nr:phosphate/phosphite/phosphonate ABC transporter substrate-binding protein [Lacipirellulaceae bacterium]
MSEPNTEHARPPVNVPRLAITLLLILAAAAGAYWYGVTSVQPTKVPALWALGMDQPSASQLASQFKDADGNSVADPPADQTEWLDPPTLNFSYLAADQERYAATFADVLAFIGERCGKPVQFQPQESPDDQLAGIKSGELHIVGINSGSVPIAVYEYGFVPLVSFGADGKLATYTMKIIARKDSSLEKVSDLRGRRLALTHPTSNSGWKAPLLLLKNEYQLTPIVDYDIASTGDHADSIKALAAGEQEVAAVASDELLLAEEHGLIKTDDYRVIYESEPFCNNTIGCPHRLKPELVGKVKQALLEFKWDGSKLADELDTIGAKQFVAVSFKDDYDLLREIEDAMGRRTREMLGRQL